MINIDLDQIDIGDRIELISLEEYRAMDAARKRGALIVTSMYKYLGRVVTVSAVDRYCVHILPDVSELWSEE